MRRRETCSPWSAWAETGSRWRAAQTELPSEGLIICHCLLHEATGNGLIVVDTGLGLEDARTRASSTLDHAGGLPNFFLREGAKFDGLPSELEPVQPAPPPPGVPLDQTIAPYPFRGYEFSLSIRRLGRSDFERPAALRRGRVRVVLYLLNLRPRRSRVRSPPLMRQRADSSGAFHPQVGRRTVFYMADDA